MKNRTKNQVVGLIFSQKVVSEACRCIEDNVNSMHPSVRWVMQHVPSSIPGLETMSDNGWLSLAKRSSRIEEIKSYDFSQGITASRWMQDEKLVEADYDLKANLPFSLPKTMIKDLESLAKARNTDVSTLIENACVEVFWRWFAADNELKTNYYFKK
jgi:hypothetical protein